MSKYFSLEENISWAAAHLLNGKYYERYKQGVLTPWELNSILQAYRFHRQHRDKNIKWYQFKAKRHFRQLMSELNQLIKEVYGVACWGRKADLSKYGVKL